MENIQNNNYLKLNKIDADKSNTNKINNNDFKLEKLTNINNEICAKNDNFDKLNNVNIDNITKLKIEKHLTKVLELLGLNLNDDNYKKTPKRMTDFFMEFTEFTRQKENMLKDHFKINFPKHKNSDNSYNGILFQPSIDVYSLCSHHLIPIMYKISFAYIPKENKQIGFSKIIRILNDIAKNPANQEDFTQKVVDIFTNNFDCKGVAILVSGIHLCMKIRGVHSNTDNKTIAMTGIFQKDKEARDRFFELINTNRN